MSRHWLFSVNISFDAFKRSLLALKNIWRVVSYIQGSCNYLGGFRRSIERTMVEFTIVIFSRVIPDFNRSVWVVYVDFEHIGCYL